MSFKPIIGITVAHCDEELKTYPRAMYVEAVKQAGGQPILLPPVSDKEDAEALVALIQGVILTGGGDISPFLLQELPQKGIGDCRPDRDLSEILLAQRALEIDLPLLGICKGIQVMAAAAGGKICQDIVSQYPRALEHKMKAPRNFPWHDVILQESRLQKFLGKERIGVNSVHHQAVAQVPPGFIINALAPDGIIEGMEKEGAPFCLGVQWHPEAMLEDPNSRKLFQELVKAGFEYMKKEKR